MMMNDEKKDVIIEGIEGECRSDIRFSLTFKNITR